MTILFFFTGGTIYFSNSFFVTHLIYGDSGAEKNLIKLELDAERGEVTCWRKDRGFEWRDELGRKWSLPGKL